MLFNLNRIGCQLAENLAVYLMDIDRAKQIYKEVLSHEPMNIKVG